MPSDVLLSVTNKFFQFQIRQKPKTKTVISQRVKYDEYNNIGSN